MGNCLLEILQICNAIIYQLIQQNSQMGSNPSQERTQKIMSLFYKPSKVWVTQEISLNLIFFDYGVCASPFEYQTQQENGQKSTQLIQLEDIFRKQYEEELGVKFNPEVKWEVGRLNSYLKTGRYSPLYYDDIGIINNKFLMSKVQFTKKWHQAFDIAIQNFLKPEELKDQKILNQKKNLLQMDWIHYRTLVVYAFRDENIPFDQIIKNRIATKYQIYMRDKFESKVINQKYKIQKLLRRLTKFDIDIFFLQDIDERILKYIEKKTNQFRIARCRFSKSAILISREALKKIVGDSIRPLAHYNRKYLDPEKKYEFGKQFDFGQKDKSSLQSTHFETNQNRNFEFAKRKQVKVAKKTELKKLHSLQQNQTRIQQKQQQSKMKKQHSLNPDVVNENFKQNHPNLQLLSNSLIGQQQSLQTIDQMGQSNQLLSGQEQLIEESQNNNTKVEGEATYAYIDPQVFKGLAWNDNTLVQFLSNIILITSSLDFEFEELQFKKMIQSLNSLHKIYPNHVIVAAVDVQKDINLEELSGFYIFPNQKEKKIPTVYKKKTLIQSKVHKAGHLFANTEDYFLSTAKLYDPMVMDIDHNETQENPRLIPSETHPYDHYLISATIKCKVTKKIIKETTEGE